MQFSAKRFELSRGTNSTMLRNDAIGKQKSIDFIIPSNSLVPSSFSVGYY